MKDSLVFKKVEDEAGIVNLATLAENIWYECFPSIISLQQIEYMLDKFLSEKAIGDQIGRGYSYYLVVKDRELVGFLAINTEVSSGKRRLFLSKLYIKKEYRGERLASKMMQFIKEQASERKCESVFLTVNKYNSHAIDVYYHWGFRKTNEMVTDIGSGYVMDDYEMTLEI